MKRKTAPKKTRAKRPKVAHEAAKSYFQPPETKRTEVPFPVAAPPAVVIVDEREVKVIPVPRSAMGQVYDFLASLVK